MNFNPVIAKKFYKNQIDEQKLLNIAFAAEKKINFKQNLNRWWEK